MISSVYSTQQALSYLPTIPSPLASRDVNVCPTFSSLMASTRNECKKTAPRTRTIRHPAVQRRVGEPERRREVFLKRVKDAGDDRRWQTRSDQALRKDFLSQKKQWEDDLMRSAPDVAAASDDDGNDQAPSKEHQEIEMVDEVLSQEDREVRALVALMDNDSMREHEHEDPPSDYGSDDEDYDRIFMEAVAAAESRSRGHNANLEAPLGRDQEMDMS